MNKISTNNFELYYFSNASLIEPFLENLDHPTPLCHIMNKYRSDKADLIPNFHHYTRLYFQLFKNFRNINLLEVGLGTNNTDVPSNMGPDGKPGASLYGWREFLPYAQIYGADIDKRILFQDDRITTYYVDQLSADTIKELSDMKLADIEFDAIIDDGLHTFEANSNLLKNIWHKLKEGGIYVIEDIQNNVDNIEQFGNFLAEYQGFLVNIKLAPHNGDNILGIIFK